MRDRVGCASPIATFTARSLLVGSISISISTLTSMIAPAQLAQANAKTAASASGAKVYGPVVGFRGSTMGTYYSIKYAEVPGTAPKNVIKEALEASLKRINQEMSTYIPSSQISRLNTSKPNLYYGISDDFGKVLSFSVELAAKTGGYFDPTIGPLVNLWGFGPNGPTKTPSDEQVDSLLRVVGARRVLHILEVKAEQGTGKPPKGGISLVDKPPPPSPAATGKTAPASDSPVEPTERFWVKKAFAQTYVDLSASAKGFAVDALSEQLAEQFGLHNTLVDIGGELKARGRKSAKNAWVIGIERPSLSSRKYQKALPLSDMAMATSGNYRNVRTSADGQVFSHTINPNTGKPARHALASVTVIARDCMAADGLATAMMAMGPEKAKSFAEKESIRAFFMISRPDGQGFQVSQSSEFTRWLKSGKS